MNPGDLALLPVLYCNFNRVYYTYFVRSGQYLFFHPENAAFQPDRYGASRPCRDIIIRYKTPYRR